MLGAPAAFLEEASTRRALCGPRGTEGAQNARRRQRVGLLPLDRVPVAVFETSVAVAPAAEAAPEPPDPRSKLGVCVAT